MDKNKDLNQNIGQKDQKEQQHKAPSRQDNDDLTGRRNVGGLDREDQERQQPGSKQNEPAR